MIGSFPLKAALCATGLLVLVACASDEPDIPDTPAETLYNDALDTLQAGKAAQAARMFDEVERQHPYSKWATQAQLMSAFANYSVDRYDDAILALNRYIDLHPGNRNAAYAYYLRALCYYEQIESVQRDQGNTEEALKDLTEVVARFPNTPYARDATLKLDLTRDHLAGKEMDIGRYYLYHNDYGAAINRFRRVVTDYQTTTHIAEALHRLVEAYLSLGIVSEAQSAGAVLGYNYPGSDWYQDSYKLLVSRNLQPLDVNGSWLGKVF
ncbi:MAG TPA: outer membrane protein assembly factor BamD [Dongiaceae bacterium]|jgi:outer membrane protein assembly factor BamD|nr:outer membrane protein assembly factor BamD [Dongiaceae bacterium]